MEEIGHPLLIFYPFDVTKKTLTNEHDIKNKKSIQKSLHLRFYMPNNTPIFQPSQSQNLKLPFQSKRLINIHTHLKNPGNLIFKRKMDLIKSSDK